MPNEPESEERVSPNVFIATLLDDVRHEMSQLRILQQSMIEEGVVESLYPRTVTTDPIVAMPPYGNKPWFGVKITNDGPASIWLTVNTEKSTDLELKPDETRGFHFKTAVITDIRLWTEEGSATVRIIGDR